MSTLRLITPPEIEPITIDELKLHLRLTEIDERDAGGTEAVMEDSLLNSLIKTARQMVENFCGPLITQSWEQYENGFPNGNILRLWKPRVQSVTSLIYTDIDDTSTTLDTDYYTTDIINKQRPNITLNYNYSWPIVTLHPVNPIKITFVCGYGDVASDIEEPIKQAILILCGHLYENRDMYNISISGKSVVPIPWTTETLIASYRAWGFEA